MDGIFRAIVYTSSTIFPETYETIFLVLRRLAELSELSFDLLWILFGSIVQLSAELVDDLNADFALSFFKSRCVAREGNDKDCQIKVN
jgi:hypothetical protein